LTVSDAQSQPPEQAVDWLGFHRIGSPDTTPRQPTVNENEVIFADSPPLPRRSSKAQRESFDHLDSAELTAPDGNKRLSNVDDTASTAAAAKRTSGAGAADKGVSEWLGSIDDGLLSKSDRKSSTLNIPGSRKGSMDFLGMDSNIDFSDRPLQRQSADKGRASFLDVGPEAEHGGKKSR
jgi:hypothetical protein